MPEYVGNALREGYKIVHKALLLSCPIPTASQIPTLRITILAVEGVMTCIMSAFRNREISYGFPDLCPWSQDLFGWAGLCSHSPLLEGMDGMLDLKPEELEAIAAMTEEHERQYDKTYQRNLRVNPTEEYRERQRRNNEKQRPALQVIHANRIANKTFYCDVCKVSCRDKASLLKHNNTPRHNKKATMGDDDYHCDLCDISFKYKSDFTRHTTSKGHIARMPP